MTPFSKSEIALAVAANSSFTDGNTVDLLGLGQISYVEGKIVFELSEVLTTIASDPEAQIKISNLKGMLPTDLWTSLASIYKHRVNVGC